MRKSYAIVLVCTLILCVVSSQARTRNDYAVGKLVAVKAMAPAADQVMINDAVVPHVVAKPVVVYDDPTSRGISGTVLLVQPAARGPTTRNNGHSHRSRDKPLSY